MSPNIANPESRIRRLVFDLHCPDEATALHVRQRLEGMTWGAVVPALEEAFAAYAPSDLMLRIDRLEIDLGRIAARDFDQGAFRQAIAAALRTAMPPPSQVQPGAASLTESLVEALVAFLLTGVWPWQAIPRTLAEAEAALRALPSDEAHPMANRLLVTLRAPAARRRLAYQFGPDLAAWIVLTALGEAGDALIRAGQTAAAVLPPSQFVEALLAVASAAPPTRPLPLHEAQGLWAAALDLTTPADAPPGRWAEAFSGAEYGAAPPVLLPFQDDAAAPTVPEIGVDAASAGGLYVDLAGVVLLHPFLPHFFTYVGLLDERQQFASFDAHVRGVHLLHFLAAGEENPAEPATTLLKVLCGLPIDALLPRELLLTEREREEAANLLLAAIGHWQKLGNATAAGLRETFLQRQGKLAWRDEAWRLVVEQRSVDVLLGYLPWGLSAIKLPWMDAPLYVDWA